MFPSINVSLSSVSSPTNKRSHENEDDETHFTTDSITVTGYTSNTNSTINADDTTNVEEHLGDNDWIKLLSTSLTAPNLCWITSPFLLTPEAKNRSKIDIDQSIETTHNNSHTSSISESTSSFSSAPSNTLNLNTTLKVAEAIKAANAAINRAKPAALPRKARLACNVDSCDFRSRSDYEKYEHLLNVHGRHVCPGCDAQLVSAEALKEHLPTHSQGRNHICSFCGRGFDLKCNLTAHCRRHTGEKHFVCKTCGKAFTRGNNLQKHELTHGTINLNKSIASTPRNGKQNKSRKSKCGPGVKSSDSDSSQHSLTQPGITNENRKRKREPDD